MVDVEMDEAPQAVTYPYPIPVYKTIFSAVPDNRKVHVDQVPGLENIFSEFYEAFDPTPVERSLAFKHASSLAKLACARDNVVTKIQKIAQDYQADKFPPGLHIRLQGLNLPTEDQDALIRRTKQDAVRSLLIKESARFNQLNDTYASIYPLYLKEIATIVDTYELLPTQNITKDDIDNYEGILSKHHPSNPRTIILIEALNKRLSEFTNKVEKQRAAQERKDAKKEEFKRKKAEAAENRSNKLFTASGAQTLEQKIAAVAAAVTSKNASGPSKSSGRQQQGKKNNKTSNNKNNNRKKHQSKSKSTTGNEKGKEKQK
ncbi:hypothetical protein HDU76_009026 [Blyttiomyces sp. JEL0837]|nr:hypothetical protein HDU76_009026 [Blyttiomyces sp. JEL0837]